MQKHRVFWASVLANLLTLLLLPEIAHAQVVTTVSCPPATGGTYSSITAALNAVGLIGPRTFMVTGTCNENVSLDEALSLTIAGAGGARIVAPQDSDAFDISRSQNITLQNLEIAGVLGSPPGSGGAGVLITAASNVQINLCDIHDNGAVGVAAAGGSELFLNKTNIHNNNPGDGLDVAGGSSARVSGSTIQNNGSHGVLNLGNPASVTGGVGVFVVGNSFAAFPNDLIQNNADVGIMVYFGAEVNLGSTTIQDHNLDGIVVQQGGHLAVNGPALVQRNGGGCPPETPIACGGIFGAGNATVALNGVGAISGNHGAGIFAEQGTNLHLNGATISNNSGDGVHIRWISTADFRNFGGGANTITGNGGASVFCDSRSLVIGDLTGFSKVNCGQTSQ